jgi:hypothetical protein
MLPYKKALGLRIAPQEEFAPCNRVPGGAAGGNSGEIPARGRRSPAGESRGVIWGLLRFGSWLDWGRGAAGEPARRSCGLAVAVSWCSRRREHGLDLLATRGVPVSTSDGLRVVGCGGEAGWGGAHVGRDGGHGASAGEGNRALYSRERGLHGSTPSPGRVPGVNAAVQRPWHGAPAGNTLETGGPPGLVRPVRRGHKSAGGAREGEGFKGPRDAGRLGEGARAASGGTEADA